MTSDDKKQLSVGGLRGGGRLVPCNWQLI